MLEFETPTGNAYAWDNKVGQFIPTSLTMRSVINEMRRKKLVSKEEIIKHLKEKFNEQEISYYYDWINKWGKIRHQNYSSQTTEELHTEENIKYFVLKRGLLHLSLCVTEDCNFRCKYCAYSDSYEYTRSHSNKYMDFAVAKKAIDCYFSLLNKGERYNPLRKPSIGFYGGEPLLNFELIKECEAYIRDTYKDYELILTMTTNGSLLNKEKANWLMEHDFFIAVSLDGPEEEHNRCRVYRNGKGTFGDVIKNIRPIMDKKYKKIYSIAVLDWRSDLFKQEEFFNREDIPSPARISLVSEDGGSRYYKQFTKDDLLAFREQLRAARSYYFGGSYQQKREKITSFFENIVGKIPERDLLSTISVLTPHPIMPFTSACVPGRKLYVDVNGYYYACEKVNGSFPIGNVTEGLNFARISKLIREYINCMDRCPECKVSRKCSFCYPKFETDNGFSCSSKKCEIIESKMKESFAETFALAEQNSELIEKDSYKYKNIKKYCGD